MTLGALSAATFGFPAQGDEPAKIERAAECLGFCPLAPVRPEARNPSGPALSEADARIASAVVRVSNTHAIDGDGRFCTEKGSGVCLESGGDKLFVLTAAHLFTDGTGNVTIRRIGGIGADASVEFIDPFWDVALLSARLDGARTLRLSNETPNVGDRSRIAGFGSDDTFRITRGEVVGYANPSRHTTFETLKTSGAVRRGDSGGPMIGGDDTLLGIVWGTDGECSYGTYCGRIRRLLRERLGVDFGVPPEVKKPAAKEEEESEQSAEKNAQAEEAQESPPSELSKPNELKKQSGSNAETTDNDNVQKESSVGSSLKEKLVGKAGGGIGDLLLYSILPALGVTVPGGVLVGWSILKILRRVRKWRKKKKSAAVSTKEKQSASTLVDRFNDYAEELNDLYRLNGRNTTADATLGRLYDTELSEAEKSSDGALADMATRIRRKIKKELCRIHSEDPIPNSEND